MSPIYTGSDLFSDLPLFVGGLVFNENAKLLSTQCHSCAIRTLKSVVGQWAKKKAENMGDCGNIV